MAHRILWESATTDQAIRVRLDGTEVWLELESEDEGVVTCLLDTEAIAGLCRTLAQLKAGRTPL